jgi:hypothetical protein
MSRRIPPWKRPRPGPGRESRPLSPGQKLAARERAERAGRRYPNLVDNLWAARQPPELPVFAAEDPAEPGSGPEG